MATQKATQTQTVFTVALQFEFLLVWGPSSEEEKHELVCIRQPSVQSCYLVFIKSLDKPVI